MINFPVFVPYIGWFLFWLHGYRWQLLFFDPFEKRALCLLCSGLHQWTFTNTNTALNSPCTCVLLTLSTHSHAGRWELAMVQKWRLSWKLSETCVSLCFQWTWKFQDQTKSTFEVSNLPVVQSGSISCALKWLLDYNTAHQNICMWEFRQTSKLHKSGKAIFLCGVHSGVPFGAWGTGWLRPQACSFVHLPRSDAYPCVCPVDCLSPLLRGGPELCSVRQKPLISTNANMSLTGK